MGGQGNSKIYIIYKFPLPNTTTTSSLDYHLRWLLSTYPLYAFSEHTFTNGGKTGTRVQAYPKSEQIWNFRFLAKYQLF